MATRGTRAKAALALVAFSLSTTRARAGVYFDPSASSDGSSEDSTGDSTDDSSESSTDGAVVATLVGLGIGVVGGIVAIIIVTAHKNRAADPAEGPADVEEGAQLLLDAGVLVARQDLGTTATLLVRSPAAMDQVTLDVARGQGPGLESLVRATGLPAARVAEAWTRASTAAGPSADRAGAERRVIAFLADVAPELRAPDNAAGELVLDLLEERERPDFPAHAPAHAWVARWLGVGPEVVQASSAEVLGELQSGTPRAARIAAESRGRELLAALAAAVAAREPGAVQARLDRMHTWGSALYAPG